MAVATSGFNAVANSIELKPAADDGFTVALNEQPPATITEEPTPPPTIAAAPPPATGPAEPVSQETEPASAAPKFLGATAVAPGGLPVGPSAAVATGLLALATFVQTDLGQKALNAGQDAIEAGIGALREAGAKVTQDPREALLPWVAEQGEGQPEVETLPGEDGPPVALGGFDLGFNGPADLETVVPPQIGPAAGGFSEVEPKAEDYVTSASDEPDANDLIRFGRRTADAAEQAMRQTMVEKWLEDYKRNEAAGRYTAGHHVTLSLVKTLPEEVRQDWVDRGLITWDEAFGR